MLIIHGDNEIASRALFISLKSQAAQSGKQVVFLSGTDLTVSSLTVAAESMSLLGSTNTVFIDGFFSRRISNEKKLLTQYFIDRPAADIVLWDGQDISASLKSFSPASVKKFDLPKYIFQFIDTFSLSLFHQALTASSAEQIFALLVRRLHDLILVKGNATSFPSWQLSKLKTQSAKFSLDQLQDLNSQLLAIDYAQKTSASPYDLSAALEFWLARISS